MGVCQGSSVTGSPGAPGNAELYLLWLAQIEVSLLLDTGLFASFPDDPKCLFMSRVPLGARHVLPAFHCSAFSYLKLGLIFVDGRLSGQREAFCLLKSLLIALGFRMLLVGR